MHTPLLHEILDSNNDLIQQIRKELAAVKSCTEELTDKSFLYKIQELTGIIDEYEQCNELAKNSLGDLVDIDFYEVFNNYFRSSSIGINKEKRVKMWFYVNGVRIYDEKDPVLKESFTVSNCLSCMRIVPTQIIDNAFKYAPTNTDIQITVDLSAHGKIISVKNLGPMIETSEIDNLFEMYRGKYAILSGIEGYGVGLSFVQTIIKAHPWLLGDLNITSSREIKTEYAGIPYSEFTISLSFEEPQLENFDKNLDTREEDLKRYLLHELIRINPQICKLGVSMFQLSFSKNQSMVDIKEELSRHCYRIKDLIISNIFYFQQCDEDFIYANDKPYNNVKRFGKQLIEEVQYINKLMDDKLDIIVNGTAFNFQMYPPAIDVFIHVFSRFLVESCPYGELEFRMDKEDIEITTDDNFTFRDHPGELDTLGLILNVHHIEMQIKNNLIRISKRNKYEGKRN